MIMVTAFIAILKHLPAQNITPTHFRGCDEGITVLARRIL